MRNPIRFAIVMIIIFMQSPFAVADAIDGQWCFEGKSFSIDGSKFVTPGGNSITGEYDRHGYAYVVPEGEPGASSRIEMTLIDDVTLNLRRPVPQSGTLKTEIWKRCEVIS